MSVLCRCDEWYDGRYRDHGGAGVGGNIATASDGGALVEMSALEGGEDGSCRRRWCLVLVCWL